NAIDYGFQRPSRPSRFIGEALGREPSRMSGPLRVFEELQRFQRPPADADAPLPALGADDVLTISYDAIDDYQRCALLYRFKHVLQIPVLPTPQMTYGLALHEAVRDYLRRKRDGEKPTLADLQAVFRAAWLAEGFINPAHERVYGERPVRTVLHFLESGERGSVAPSEDSIGAVRALVSATAGRIRSRDFLPNPKSLRTCQQCPYHQICPSSLTARSATATAVAG